jgi:hypothetical protein
MASLTSADGYVERPTAIATLARLPATGSAPWLVTRATNSGFIADLHFGVHQHIAPNTALQRSAIYRSMVQ